MEIKKVINFTQEEIEILTVAGKLLKSVGEALKNKEAEAIAAESKQLLNALVTVLNTITVNLTKED